MCCQVGAEPGLWGNSIQNTEVLFQLNPAFDVALFWTLMSNLFALYTA